MQVELQESGKRLVVRFEQEDALDATLEKARADSLILRLETRLDEGAAVLLVLGSEARRVELPARVKQVFRSGVDRFGTLLAVDLAAGRELPLDGTTAPAALEPFEPVAAFEVGPATGSPVAVPPAEPAEQLAAASDSGLDPEVGSFPDVGVEELELVPESPADDAALDADGDAGTGADGGPVLAGETLGASVMFELQRMRPDEKVRLATKANRAQRQVLLRDRTPQVLLALLNNPWLENAEVLEMAKNPKVVGPVLQRLADDRRFGVNAQIQSALARNPSTPWTVTTRLLPLLHTRELRELARSPHVREAVRKAALKLYLGRM